MSRFLDPLETVSLVPGKVWMLLKEFRYESDLIGSTITVPSGFKTDFASVPRVPLAYLVGGGIGDDAAVIHDYLYQTHQTIHRKTVDQVFYEALLVLGISQWRARTMYQSVRWFGQHAWDVSYLRYASLQGAGKAYMENHIV